MASLPSLVRIELLRGTATGRLSPSLIACRTVRAMKKVEIHGQSKRRKQEKEVRRFTLPSANHLRPASERVGGREGEGERRSGQEKNRARVEKQREWDESGGGV